MIYTQGYKTLQYLLINAEWWGQIAPPAESFQYRTTGLDKFKPYLDIGVSGKYVRNLWVSEIYVNQSGTGGGFKTTVSGVNPVHSYHLATKGYVDTAIAGITPGGSISFSGLNDVFDGPWTSGYFVSWNGIEFVPSSGILGLGGGPGKAAGSGLVEDAGYYNLGIGSGLYLQPDLVGFDTGWADQRYQLSGMFGGGGEANTGANVGTGFGWFRDKTIVTLNFKSITSGTGISLTNNADTIQVSFNNTYGDARYSLSGTYAVQGDLNNRLHLSGGTLTGQLNVNAIISGNNTIYGLSFVENGIALSTKYALSGNYALKGDLNNRLHLSGGTVTGQLNVNAIISGNNNIYGLSFIEAGQLLSARYAASGYGFAAGSGLISVGQVYHVQIGSGLYLQQNLVGFDETYGFQKFETSGSVLGHVAINDPHIAYVKADGTRGFYGRVSGLAPVNGWELVTKAYGDARWGSSGINPWVENTSGYSATTEISGYFNPTGQAAGTDGIEGTLYAYGPNYQSPQLAVDVIGNLVNSGTFASGYLYWTGSEMLEKAQIVVSGFGTGVRTGWLYVAHGKASDTGTIRQPIDVSTNAGSNWDSFAVGFLDTSYTVNSGFLTNVNLADLRVSATTDCTMNAGVKSGWAYLYGAWFREQITTVLSSGLITVALATPTNNVAIGLDNTPFKLHVSGDLAYGLSPAAPNTNNMLNSSTVAWLNNDATLIFTIKRSDGGITSGVVGAAGGGGVVYGAGSGLISTSETYHVQIGSGLYLLNDLVGLNTAFTDARYSLSGSHFGIDINSRVHLSGGNMTGNLYTPNIKTSGELMFPAVSIKQFDSDGSIQISGLTGYLQVGPQNTSFSHFYTSAPAFFFGKDVYVDGVLVISGNAASSSSNAHSYQRGVSPFHNLWNFSSGQYTGPGIQWQNRETLYSGSWSMKLEKSSSGLATGDEVFFLRQNRGGEYINYFYVYSSDNDIVFNASKTAGWGAFGNVTVANGNFIVTNGTITEGAQTLAQKYQASGLYYTFSQSDVRYAASGYAYSAGSGLISNNQTYHVQIGSGLYLQNNLVGFDEAYGYQKFEASGSMVAHINTTDPHLAYVKTDASRGFYAPISGAAPVNGWELATKAYGDARWGSSGINPWKETTSGYSATTIISGYFNALSQDAGADGIEGALYGPNYETPQFAVDVIGNIVNSGTAASGYINWNGSEFVDKTQIVLSGFGTGIKTGWVYVAHKKVNSTGTMTQSIDISTNGGSNWDSFATSYLENTFVINSGLYTSLNLADLRIRANPVALQTAPVKQGWGFLYGAWFREEITTVNSSGIVTVSLLTPTNNVGIGVENTPYKVQISGELVYGLKSTAPDSTYMLNSSTAAWLENDQTLIFSIKKSNGTMTSGVVGAVGGGGGEANLGSNQGTGFGWFKDKTGVTLNFKSITSGTGISLVNNTNDIQVLFNSGFGDGRYSLSGNIHSTIAGSGLILNNNIIHTQVGSGLYLQNDLVGFSTSFGDGRYALSGSNIVTAGNGLIKTGNSIAIDYDFSNTWNADQNFFNTFAVGSYSRYFLNNADIYPLGFYSFTEDTGGGFPAVNWAFEFTKAGACGHVLRIWDAATTWLDIDDANNPRLRTWDGSSLQYVVNDNRVLTAGSGLIGGGNLSADRVFNVGAGWGITVNPDDIAVASGTLDSRYSLSGNYVNKTGDMMTGDLYVSGNIRFNSMQGGVTYVSGSSYTIRSTDFVVVSSGAAGALNYYLPAAQSVPGKVYHIKFFHGTSLTINASGTQSIDVALNTYNINTLYESIQLISDGTDNWWVI